MPESDIDSIGTNMLKLKTKFNSKWPIMTNVAYLPFPGFYTINPELEAMRHAG